MQPLAGVSGTQLLGFFCFCFCFLRVTFFKKIYLFMAVLGLRFCARAFSSCGKRGPLFIAVCGPLTIAASLVAEHRLQSRRLSSCGLRAQLLRGMWESSQTRARTHVPCFGRQILNHCATREAHYQGFYYQKNGRRDIEGNVVFQIFL